MFRTSRKVFEEWLASIRCENIQWSAFCLKPASAACLLARNTVLYLHSSWVRVHCTCTRSKIIHFVVYRELLVFLIRHLIFFLLVWIKKTFSKLFGHFWSFSGTEWFAEVLESFREFLNISEIFGKLSEIPCKSLTFLWKTSKNYILPSERMDWNSGRNCAFSSKALVSV